MGEKFNRGEAIRQFAETVQFTEPKEAANKNNESNKGKVITPDPLDAPSRKPDPETTKKHETMVAKAFETWQSLLLGDAIEDPAEFLYDNEHDDGEYLFIEREVDEFFGPLPNNAANLTAARSIQTEHQCTIYCYKKDRGQITQNTL